MRIGLLAALWLSASLCVELGAQGAVPLHYDVPGAVTLHEPIIVDWAVTNRSAETVTVDFGESFIGEFVVEARFPDGSGRVARQPTRNTPPFQGGLRPIGVMKLAPGEGQHRWLVLNDWLDFSVVGSYLVTIRFTGSVEGGDVTGRVTTWEIRVLPRNETALEDVCRRLLQGSLDFDGRASNALTSVEDQVAIPFLLAAAEKKSLASAEIDALARLGGPDARAALSKLAQSGNEITAQLAEGALKRIR